MCQSEPPTASVTTSGAHTVRARGVATSGTAEAEDCSVQEVHGDATHIIFPCTAAASTASTPQLEALSAALTNGLSAITHCLDAIKQSQVMVQPPGQVPTAPHAPLYSHANAPVKLPTFDGAGPLDTYLEQFALVTRLNKGRTKKT